jgi:2-hydroxychromene-2-carboxylate isomerase
VAARAIEHLTRRTLPRALALSSQVTLPARVGAASRRRAGRVGRLELYFAFDDPCSAVAVPDLIARLKERRVRPVLMPVVRRGMADDPAVEDKRTYSVIDARRLARVNGLELRRSEPPDPAATAFLAHWAAGAPASPGLTGFCCDALNQLWFESAGAIQRAVYEQLYMDHLGFSPPPTRNGESEPVRACEARMSRRGMYETPAAWVSGRWYFAHDRPQQICEWLDQLGWGESPEMAVGS